MSDIRINALATTAASTASDDYIAIDGSANGTRKLSAYSPTFGGNLTVSGAGPSTFSGKVTISNASATDGALRLQSTGALGFFDFEAADTQLVIQGNNNPALTISTAGNTTVNGNLTVSGGTVTSGTGALTLNSSGNSVILQSAGTTALTLDSSQNATFAGTVRSTGAITALSDFYHGNGGAKGYWNDTGIFGPSTGDFIIRAGNNSNNTIIAGNASGSHLTISNTGDATFAGKVTPTGGIVGTTTNNNAAAGNVGEYVEGVVLRASAVSLTTATVGNVSSITLGAGDWDVSGYVSFLAGGSTVRTLILSGLANGTSSLPDIENGSRVAQAGSVTGGTDIGMATAIVRYSLTGNTTIYLNAYSEFTTSTMQAYGVIRARRVR